MSSLRLTVAAALTVSTAVLLGAPVVIAQQQPAKQSAATVKAEAPTSMCTGCHTIPGYQASFPRVFRVPKISGQSAKYLEAALQAYKKGDRNHPTMQAVAASLTDEQIVSLAAYYAARGSEPTTVATK